MCFFKLAARHFLIIRGREVTWLENGVFHIFRTKLARSSYWERVCVCLCVFPLLLKGGIVVMPSGWKRLISGSCMSVCVCLCACHADYVQCYVRFWFTFFVCFISQWSSHNCWLANWQLAPTGVSRLCGQFVTIWLSVQCVTMCVFGGVLVVCHNQRSKDKTYLKLFWFAVFFFCEILNWSSNSVLYYAYLDTFFLIICRKLI